MYVKIKNEDGTMSLVHSDLCGDHLEHYGLPRRSIRGAKYVQKLKKKQKGW